MPGHMNVLLAEADVPYEQLLDIEQAGPMLPRTDVALILGANDVVNPSARDDATSPIYGMPILEVDRASRVIVVKRSLSPGFAGIDNPLFYDGQHPHVLRRRQARLGGDHRRAEADLSVVQEHAAVSPDQPTGSASAPPRIRH